MSLQYKKLVVWQRADDLFIAVHRLTHERFPSEERYELGRQMRKAAHSVPARHRQMPYRVFLRLVGAKLRASAADKPNAYRDADEFAADLQLIADTLDR